VNILHWCRAAALNLREFQRPIPRRAFQRTESRQLCGARYTGQRDNIRLDRSLRSWSRFTKFNDDSKRDSIRSKDGLVIEDQRSEATMSTEIHLRKVGLKGWTTI
jgi:hypothetical protein